MKMLVILLVLMVPAVSFAGVTDDMAKKTVDEFKQSVSKEFHDYKQQAKDDFKVFAIVMAKLVLTIFVGLLVSYIFKALQDNAMVSIVRLTTLFVCIRLLIP